MPYDYFRDVACELAGFRYGTFEVEARAIMNQK